MFFEDELTEEVTRNIATGAPWVCGGDVYDTKRCLDSTDTWEMARFEQLRRTYDAPDTVLEGRARELREAACELIQDERDQLYTGSEQEAMIAELGLGGCSGDEGARGSWIHFIRGVYSVSESYETFFILE